MKYAILPTLGALLLCSCAGLETSIGVGAGVGAMSGAVAGHSANFNIKGMALSTGAGAVLGGLMGLLLHKHGEARAANPGKPPEVPHTIDGEPILQDAEKEVLWIPGKVENDRYTEPHRIFVIKRPSRWSPPEDKSADGD